MLGKRERENGSEDGGTNGTILSDGLLSPGLELSYCLRTLTVTCQDLGEHCG